MKRLITQARTSEATAFWISVCDPTPPISSANTTMSSAVISPRSVIAAKAAAAIVVAVWARMVIRI